MPFIPVADAAVAVEQISECCEGFLRALTEERAERWTMVWLALLPVKWSELVVDSQWTSLGFAIVLTFDGP